MQQSASVNLAAMAKKEVGPIVVALAFVIILGGVTAAAITICGWGNVKSASLNVIHRSAEIVCKS